jgi:hypothetical protein
VNGPAHYAAAERLLSADGWGPPTAAEVAQAQVHATLALAAATALPGGTDTQVAWAQLVAVRPGPPAHRVDTEIVRVMTRPITVTAACSCGSWYERVDNPSGELSEDDLMAAMHEKIRAHVEGG